jgi:hypothetical protein
MQQNNFSIEIPRSPTLVMGSYPSTNIAQLLHDEIVLQFGIGGCAPEGSEPLIDSDALLFPKVEEPVSLDEIRILARYLLEAA